MPDYQLGKIYKLVGNGKVYVGSTTRPLLCQRMSEHRSKCKLWKKGTNKTYTTSFECLEDPKCYIELLEVYPCDSRDELHKCERKWIEALECINKVIPTRTVKEYDKIYREQNKERIKKEYEKNKEQISQQKKEYYQINKDHFQQQAREYRAKKKLLASNSVSIDPTNLLIEIEPQEANLIVEHE
jgi:hypothetical protein